MHNFHSYAPSDGHGLAHDPLTSILGPRPIAWISSRNKEGRLNLAPYSFFNVFNYRPPIVAFSSVGSKDTVKNIEETGEFVCNLATRSLAAQVNQSSATVFSEADEFALTQLTPLDSVKIAAPRVLESPVSMECRVTQIQQLLAHDGRKLDTWMVFGEIVHVHIADHLIVEGNYKTTLAHPILRGGGAHDYFEITEDARFSMVRPP